MARQLLNLPINIPWKQIAVSPDMMDTQFCNKQFPFAWRSSIAISTYEPSPDELPEELCEDRITYLKITASITGYQPTKEETRRLNDSEPQLAGAFPNVPVEDIRDAIERITDEYFACYGVLLNVAVFPYPMTRREFNERLRIVIRELSDTQPGALLDNPFVHSSGVTFEASGEESNRIVDLFPTGGDGNGELDLHETMVITIAQPEAIEAVEAKVVHYTSSGVTMEAFKGAESIETQTTGSEQGQIHKLYIEGEGIDRVVLTAPDNHASLLEFAYFVGPAREVPIELKDYPHIIDFEPKVRDLYQAASETGEVLTGSKAGVKVDKSFTHTESTESKLSLAATVGAEIPGTPLKLGAQASTTRTNTESDQEHWAVQTDASRERRETQGTTTQLSQMYNLLTGYHAGTNRSAHLLLARPHVLQPTDKRTFVQGLRAIEGLQEFFLIVIRPPRIEGLCIEVALETGHFPEDVDIETPKQEFERKTVVYRFGPIRSRRREFEFERTVTIFNVNDDWEFDYESVIGAVTEVILPDDNAYPPYLWNYSYNIEEPNRLILNGAIAPRTIFHREYHIALRRSKGTPGESKADVSKLLITHRGLCACFKSGDCPEVVAPPVPAPPVILSIVDEPTIRINPALLTRSATSETRMPAIKELLRGIQNAMTTSWRTPKRHAFGEVGFLESDYFKDQIKKLIPEDRLETPIARLSGLPESVARSLGERYTVADALELDLASFTRRTGLSIEEAARARQRLLGLSPGETQGGDPGNEMKH
jgi:hypothetical protein